MSGNQMLWMAAGAGLTLLLAGIGYYLWHWARWRRHGDTAQIEQELGRYFHQMVNQSEDRQAMRRLLAIEIPESLQVRQAALLFLVNHELVDESEMRLAVNHPAVRQVAANGSAMAVDAGLRRLIQQSRLDLTWSATWVPLMRGTNLYGLWLLGEQQDGRSLTPNHLQALTTLARQAALILETVQIAQREQESAQQLQRLYHQAVSAGEVERSRLARELHDGVLQELCALARDLKSLGHESDQPAEPWEPLIGSVNESVNTLRLLCHNLRPPLLTSNLPLALQALVERVGKQATAFISFKATIETLALSEETTIAIFRIAQEALNNAIHHADASEIQLRLTQYPAMLRLTVSDDGRGIANLTDLGAYVAAGHYGLAGMRERAKMIGAQLEFHSVPDYGTAVILQTPLSSLR